MESILESIKKMLGIPEGYEEFDPDLIMHINSVIFILSQEGVGPETFNITGPGETWVDYLGERNTKLASIRSYIYLKVKLLFDSASLSSSVIESTKNMIAELEWRLYATNPY